MTLDTQYEPILALAKTVGTFQKASFGRKDLVIHTKSTAVDFVTEIDRQSDEMIVAALKQLFPEDSILSEEGGLISHNEGYTWIVDPLDGTTNYASGHPIYAVSIARWKGETPEFGVVYMPSLDETYCAQRGKGAFKNQAPIAVSTIQTLGQALLATGFPYDRATAKNVNTENVTRMVPRVKGIRRLGAAAYDLCLVAAGVYDGYWELRLGKWDFAAGALIITEAGGVFEATAVKGGYNVLAGSAAVADAISKVVDLSDAE